jgi:hypothetical protein
MLGFEQMCAAIEPEAVICYAQPFERMYDFADIIEVPYTKIERVARAIPQKEEE